MIDDAIAEFNRALAYKPNDNEIHQKLGIAYTAKGWADKAKYEFALYHQDDIPVKKNSLMQQSCGVHGLSTKKGN